MLSVGAPCPFDHCLRARDVRTANITSFFELLIVSCAFSEDDAMRRAGGNYCAAFLPQAVAHARAPTETHPKKMAKMRKTGFEPATSSSVNFARNAKVVGKRHPTTGLLAQRKFELLPLLPRISQWCERLQEATEAHQRQMFAVEMGDVSQYSPL